MLHRRRPLFWAGFGQLVGSRLRSGNLAVIWSGIGRELVNIMLVVDLPELVAVGLGQLEALGVVPLKYPHPFNRVIGVERVMPLAKDKIIEGLIPHVEYGSAGNMRPLKSTPARDTIQPGKLTNRR